MPTRPSPLVRALCLCLAVGMPARAHAQATSAGAEEKAIGVVLARFYDGWNAHDVDRMVSAYADDVDHVNVYGEWHKGKPSIREDLTQFHAGPARNSHKTYTIEKIRFITPEAAVAHVRSLSTVGNIGTYVLSKTSGQWLVVTFTNVGYPLDPSAPKTGITKKPGA